MNEDVDTIEAEVMSDTAIVTPEDVPQIPVTLASRLKAIREYNRNARFNKHTKGVFGKTKRGSRKFKRLAKANCKWNERGVRRDTRIQSELAAKAQVAHNEIVDEIMTTGK